MAKNVGLVGGRFQACPETANCVSSQEARGGKHYVEPLRYEGDLERAKGILSEVLLVMPRTRIVTRQDNYWHVEFSSRLFGFIDNVEFLFDPVDPVIHVRSASRVGTYDWGVNARRVEKIRGSFMERLRLRRPASVRVA
jgi:uncharacterized protein (DUF1499 family)